MAYFSSWRSPSNIALIKYWGKHGIQLPRNPSLSFTLSACHTDMKLHVIPEDSFPSVTVLYNGEPKPEFEPKINSFFNKLHDQLSWLKKSAIVVDSINTFPQGAGIASSASAMSALALCLADIDDQMQGRTVDMNQLWWQRVSGYARLGSGSACRSVFSIASLWGKTPDINESSNEYAIPWGEKLAALYKNYQDTILIVSAGEKSVSSTEGHERMSNLPYADVRYVQATKNLISLIESLGVDNETDSFISICESEALQLHALMMAGPNPFILIEPETIAIIKQVWKFRKETGVPVCFTLDAGPNVHLLYPAAAKSSVLSWIKSDLAKYCHEGQYIIDEVGSGPIRL